MASGYHFRLALFALALSIVPGGFLPAQQAATDSRAEKLTPEDAKAALLAMMRSKAGQELSWFQGDVADQMEKMKIAAEKTDGWYAWTGAFRFHPTKAIYSLVIKPQEGVRACLYEYEGSFVRKDGTWSATAPRLVVTAQQLGK